MSASAGSAAAEPAESEPAEAAPATAAAIEAAVPTSAERALLTTAMDDADKQSLAQRETLLRKRQMRQIAESAAGSLEDALAPNQAVAEPQDAQIDAEPVERTSAQAAEAYSQATSTASTTPPPPPLVAAPAPTVATLPPPTVPASAAPPPPTAESNECIVCLDAPKTHLFVPCGQCGTLSHSKGPPNTLPSPLLIWLIYI